MAGNLALSDEWLLSKRLATELRLLCTWRGNSLAHPQQPTDSDRFQVVEEVNFSKIMLGCSQTYRPGLKTFTVSRCGRYLLVRSGHDIFVYRLFGPSDAISAVVRLAADRNVLRVSMDSSSGRRDVGALLEDRTGILWEIGEDSKAGQSSSASSSNLWTQAALVEEPKSPTCSSGLSTRPYLYSTGSQVSMHSALFGSEAMLSESPEPVDIVAGPSTGVPIQAQPKQTFHDLGTPDDPPRSVAVCPQRKCLAFGCRTGVELHWVDALTGGDLNRWFPLVAPSDNLYFLPQQLPRGRDSCRKLRLISSAHGPSLPLLTRSGSMPGRMHRRQRTHDRNRRQSMTRLFFGSLPFPAPAVLPRSWTVAQTEVEDQDDRRGVLRAVDCDHYQAIPIFDGSHVLYTDPASGQLCIGSDAPVGAPTKLIRKVAFVQPQVIESDGWSDLMFCYTAASEARWGVRVVAAHRDGRVILYTIPSDTYALIRRLRSSMDVWDETAGVFAQSDLLMDDALGAHPNSLADADTGNEASQQQCHASCQPIQIDGVQIAHVGQEIVDDVAINAEFGSIRVWIFCRSGLARLLALYTDPEHRVSARFPGADGHLYTEIMNNPPGSGDESPGPKGKGKERAQGKIDQDWPSDQDMPLTGYDGMVEVDVDTVGGVWIDDTRYERRTQCNAYPLCPVCGDPLASNIPTERVEIAITGSGVQDRPLFARFIPKENNSARLFQIIGQ